MLRVIGSLFSTVYTVISWLISAVWRLVSSFLIGFFTVFIAKMLYYAVRDRNK